VNNDNKRKERFLNPKDNNVVSYKTKKLLLLIEEYDADQMEQQVIFERQKKRMDDIREMVRSIPALMESARLAMVGIKDAPIFEGAS
jgi:hypothetical protein